MNQPDGLRAPRNVSEGWFLTATLALALLVRLLYLRQIASLPFFEHPVGDSAIYLERARDILSGHVLPAHPFFYGSLFYPYALAGLLAVGGRSLLPVYLVQA